eukprot:Sspe_Gene.33212::Locus_16237_Transcript_1_1_Confidence_1.000_Length_12018::g.33212::m.33212
MPMDDPPYSTDALYSKQGKEKYPANLYKEDEDDSDDEGFVNVEADLLLEVLDHTEGVLPRHLQSKLEECVGIEQALDYDSDEERKKRWTQVDLPQGQHQCSSAYDQSKPGQNQNQGRLCGPAEGWVCGEPGTKDVWYQLDAGCIRPIGGVIIKGNEDWCQYIQEFRVQYSDDGETWEDLEADEDFEGPMDECETAEVYFDNPPVARFIRIIPTSLYDDYATGRFGLFIEVSNKMVLDHLATFVKENPQWAEKRIRSYIDKICSKFEPSVASFYYKGYRRLVDGLLEEIADSQGLKLARILDLVASDQRGDKVLPPDGLWPLLIAAKDIETFTRITMEYKALAKSRFGSSSMDAGNLLKLEKGTPDVQEMVKVKEAPQSMFDMWKGKQEAIKLSSNSLPQRLASLKQAFETGALTEEMYAQAVRRCEMQELSLGWMNVDNFPPIWLHPTFTSEFLSYHFSEDIPPYQGIQVFCRLLRDVILDQQAWVGMNDAEFAVLQWVFLVMVQSVPLFQRYDKYLKLGYPTHMELLVNDVGEIIRKMQCGDAAVFPITKERKLLVVEVMSEEGMCRVTIVNTKPETQYHPKFADVPARMRQHTCVSIDNVPLDVVGDKAWWAFVLPYEGPEDVFYTHYVNWLHQGVPYEAAIAKTHEESEVRLPCAGGGMLWKAMHHACGYLMSRNGVRKSVRKLLKFNIRHQLLQWVINDLHVVKEVPSAHRRLVRLGCEAVASSAAKSPGIRQSTAYLKAVTHSLNKVEEVLLERSPDSLADAPPLLNLDTGFEKHRQSELFPGAEYLRRIDDIEHLVGERVPEANFLPANFLHVPDAVWSLPEALSAIRYADLLCTRVMVQKSIIRNHVFLTVALIQHLFIWVLPVPRFNNPSCIWQHPLTYSQQLDILNLLGRVMEHWVAACFSLKPTPEFDIVRITVLGSIMAIADCIIRQVAVDEPSRFSQHLSGHRDKAPFAPSVGYFSKQSETMKITCPEISIVRTAILDYFESLHETVPAENSIFNWERGMDKHNGCSQLFFQLTQAEAFPLGQQHRYLMSITGDNPHVLVQKNFPEVTAYRDICFYFKYFMNTMPGGFPATGNYTQLAAQLTWSFDDFNQRYQVQAFGMVLIPLARPDKHRWPSYAAPARFTFPNEAITEDDILHIKTLPSFGDIMGQRDSELLLSYLTTPYVRVPLVLHFFATEERVSLLRAPAMQQLLDSVLFEPGRYQPIRHTDVCPAMVPAENDNLLATPFGLLLNELQHSPAGVVRPLIQLLNLAIELDSGTVMNSTAVDVMLYLVRLIARVYNYLWFVIAFSTKSFVSGWSDQELRGFTPVSKETVSLLQGFQREFQATLGQKLHPMLEAWIEEAMNRVTEVTESGRLAIKATEEIDTISQLVAKLHAHAVLVYRNAALSTHVTSSLMSSFVFLTLRHTWNSGKLIVPETEVYEVMQLQRRRLAGFLCQAPPHTLSEVLDGIVRVATSTGSRKARPEDITNDWSYIQGFSSVARFTHACKNPRQKRQLQGPPASAITAVLEGASFVSKNGGEYSFEDLKGKTLGLYFSASWCPPCRAFTPDLTHFYNRYKATHPDFEIILVTADRTDEEMHDYFAEMGDWLAIPFADMDRRQALDDLFHVKGIPTFLIISPEMTLVNMDGKDKVARGLDYVLKTGWEPPPPADLIKEVREEAGKCGIGQLHHSVPFCPEWDKTVEISVMTFQFTFKSGHLKALQTEIAEDPDLEDVFGEPPEKLRTLQCATVEKATYREWIRLVGRDHDIQFWNQPDVRIVLPLCDREYPEEIEDSEKWIGPIFDTVKDQYLIKKSGYWIQPYLIYIGDEVVKDDEVAAYLEVVDPDTGEKVKEVYVFKQLKCVHIYDIFSFGRRYYRSLVYSTDARTSMKFLQPTPKDRDHHWQPGFRHEAGNWSTSMARRQDSIILRHVECRLNRAGCIEQFIPARLLHGLLPDCLLNSHLFWQDAQDCLRGYPIHQGDGAKPHHLLFVQLRDVRYQNMMASFTTFRVVRYADAENCPKTRERKPKKKCQAADLPDVDELDLIRTSTFAQDEMAREMTGEFSRQMSSFGQAESDERPPAKPAAQAEDQDLLLVDLLHAREGTPLYSLAQLLMRVEDLSHCLVWTNNLYPQEGENIDLTWVHLPRLKLSFRGKATKAGIVLTSLDHAHLHVSNFRSELIVNLIKGAPHALLLQDVNGQMSVLIPAFRVHRPVIKDDPFTTELVILRSDTAWLDACDTRYFLYPVHISLSFLLTPTLASSLYLLLLRFQHRIYDDSFRLAGMTGTDAQLTSQEENVFNAIGQIVDVHPEAHACRCRISLQTVDSPLELEWYVPKEAYHYLVKKSKISATCRLNQAEELLLMTLVDSTEKKMDIIQDHAVRDKKAWQLLLEKVADIEEFILECSLNQRRMLKGFLHTLQKALRDELQIRCPWDDVVKLVKMFCKHLNTSINFCREPYVKCLLHNHFAYVKAETNGEETAPVEVPELGGNKHWSFETHYEELAEPRSVSITHTFQRQMRGYELLRRASETLDGYMAGTKIDICGSSRPPNNFLFFLELLTGETALKLKKDILNGYAVVWLLLPFCYWKPKKAGDNSWQSQRYLIAAMQAIVNNPELLQKMPFWGPDRKDKDVRGRRTWNDSLVVFSSFMRDMQTMLADWHKEGKLHVPPNPTTFPKIPVPPDTIDVVRKPKERPTPSTPLLATSCLPSLKNTACEARRLDTSVLKGLSASVDGMITPHQLAAFSSKPLSAVKEVEEAIERLTRKQRGVEEVSGKLPFTVENHPSSNSEVAQSMLARLHKDMGAFAEKANKALTSVLKGLALPEKMREMILNPHGKEIQGILKSLRTLREKVTEQRDADAEFLEQGLTKLRSLANEVPKNSTDPAVYSFELRRFCRKEVDMWLEYILGSLISSDLQGDLQKLNPFLDDKQVERISQLTTMCLLVASRVGQANKCREEVTGMIELIEGLGKDLQAAAEGHHIAPVIQEERALARLAAMQQKSEAAAGMMSMARSFLTKEEGKETFLFDPRYLLFEFTWNIVLRGTQVEMVGNFVRSLRARKSHVKQMIMGAGKTTVVGPLVALMSADGETLLMQVVPPSLLDFSRGVLRSTFACLMPKQIYSFVCDRTAEIDSQVVGKFSRAAASRGIVVTTPSSLKSIYLKFVEGLERMEDSTRLPPPPEHEKETRDLHSLISLWRARGVLIMDEVDLLLHPLKSELNFPIGEKHDLPMAPVRWRLPIHLLDAVYYKKLGRMSVAFKDSPKAKQILAELSVVLAEGYENRALQDTPHLILLNLEFYSTKMKPLMARWLQLWLEAQHITSLSEQETIDYLSDHAKRLAMAEKVEKTVPREDIKLLNLGYDWLQAFLPHTLQKIDRVSFGIMTPFDIERALEDNPQMPRSRIKLAIPFIGKDLPSQSSEFAHPDVVIGLTVLAYRYEGLREADFTEVLKQVQSAVEKEVGKYSQRRTNKMYERWIEAANGKLLDTFDYRKGGGTVESEFDETLQRSGSSFLTRQGTTLMTQTGEINPDVKFALSAAAIASVIAMVSDALFVEVVPLRKLKQSNVEEVQKLFKLLRLTPEVVHWYLEEIVFPEYMRHQILKLSASGQELGSSVIFRSRIGFSGTPSDLLPEELGKCDYEKCTDGQLIHTLTNPHVASYQLMDKGWTVQGVLGHIADQQPPFHALIDTGALITGMSNLEVAQFLMAEGRMPQMEGVVFLDELDRKMILVRATGRVIKLEECGIPRLKRFTFYDQVHTTGLDVPHTPNAQAAITLGKDMTFRDFAQGAYRMRGIGAGQTVNLIIIPEVYDLIVRELASAGQPIQASPIQNSAWCVDEPLIREVLVGCVCWLIINSMRTEKLQYNQLCIQKIANIYRKSAFDTLMSTQEQFTLTKGVKPSASARNALNIFREPIEFDLPDTVPKDKLFATMLKELYERPDRKEFISKDDMKVIDRIIGEVTREAALHQENHDVQMVQEQEEEKEEEEE